MFAFVRSRLAVEATTSNISLSTLQNALAGRYSFERELGRGGMATVYLARDLTHNRYVAVKVLLPELAVTLGVERFLREIEVGTVLQHPRIVGVLDSGQADGVLYYVMPFVNGATLRDKLNREKQLSVDDTITITQQVADALAYAHSKGVIHRDIKPENILLNDTGALVADFGIARAVSVAGGETLTRTGMAVGTPTYMSPEQAMGEQGRHARERHLQPRLRDVRDARRPAAVHRSDGDGAARAALARQRAESQDRAWDGAGCGRGCDRARDGQGARGSFPLGHGLQQRAGRQSRCGTASARQHRGELHRGRDGRGSGVRQQYTTKAVGHGGRPRTRRHTRCGWLVRAQGHARRQGRRRPRRRLREKEHRRHVLRGPEPEKELAYLADGLTESLIDELSAVPQLKVASRNGSAAFKGKVGVPDDSIARTLKIGTIVSGTVEPAGEGRVRVTVRLNDALSTKQIGKTQIEQPVGNTLALQDSIARQVSEFLRERVGKEIQDLTSKVATNNPAAWESMQRSKQTEAETDALVEARDVPAALAKFNQADSAYANVEMMDGNWRTPIVARAWLSYRAARLVGSGPEYPKWIDRGLAHADRALAKEPNDADAIEARGTLHYLQWLTNLAPSPSAAQTLLASAETDLRASIASSAQRATAHNTLSHLPLNRGKLTEAKLEAETAYQTDPFLTNVEATVRRLYLSSLDLQNREEADKWCTVYRARFPKSYRGTECKLWLYTLPAAEKPNMAEVWKTYDEYVKVSPANVQEFDKLKGKMMVGLALVRAGQLDSAKAIAESAQGDPQVDPRRETVNLAAIIYAQSGDKDKAIDLIAKWFAANPQQRAVAANDDAWWFENIRQEPRYKALVKPSN